MGKSTAKGRNRVRDNLRKGWIQLKGASRPTIAPLGKESDLEWEKVVIGGERGPNSSGFAKWSPRHRTKKT